MTRHGLAIVCLTLAATGCAPAPKPAKSWINGSTDGKLYQLETQLRGFDMDMVETGYRFTELYFAGKDRNWPYAKYQVEKIDKAIRLGLIRRPKRAASAQSFLEEDLPAMMRAVEKQETETFTDAIGRLRASCAKCHAAEKVPHFAVEFPERRASPIRIVR